MEKRRLDAWNRADTTLLCAALCFVAALGFNRIYPESILSEGFLFVTEAALVGGIADWFAVTALFKKPLGFPFHTAILPNRREEFIKSSSVMIQQEFFSRKTLFKKIGDVRWIPLLTEKLEREETRQLLIGEIFSALKNYISSTNKESQAKTIAIKLRREFGNLPAKDLIQEFGRWLKSSGKDTELFIGLIKKLREVAARPETLVKLQQVLEDFASKNTKAAGAFSLLMAGLAQMLDFVNFEEAAAIMQRQLLKLLDELSIDSPLQRWALKACREKISELSDTAEFRDLIERLQVDLAAELPIEETITTALDNLERQVLSVDLTTVALESQTFAQDSGSKNLGEILAKTLLDLYDKFVDALKNDGAIKSALEKFLHELTARATIYAQPLIGAIAKSALDRMTPEQINELVYGKVETDLVWIRMNGSIVGSLIGVVIFVLIKAFS